MGNFKPRSDEDLTLRCRMLEFQREIEHEIKSLNYKKIPYWELIGMTQDNKEDNINNPAHYTQGIECIDYITSHKMNFLEGNVVKYITRYKDKNGVEDLKKCKWYLEKLIEETK